MMNIPKSGGKEKIRGSQMPDRNKREYLNIKAGSKDKGSSAIQTGVHKSKLG